MNIKLHSVAYTKTRFWLLLEPWPWPKHWGKTRHYEHWSRLRTDWYSAWRRHFKYCWFGLPAWILFRLFLQKRVCLSVLQEHQILWFRNNCWTVVGMVLIGMYHQNWEKFIALKIFCIRECAVKIGSIIQAESMWCHMWPWLCYIWFGVIWSVLWHLRLQLPIS